MSQRFQIKSPNPASLSHHKERLVTSPQNTHVKRWLSLYERKGIKKYQQCLVSGKRIILETLNTHPSLCKEILYPPNIHHLQDLPGHVIRFRLSHELFHRIDTAGTSFPLLVCHTREHPPIDLTAPPQGLEVLCPLGDPINLGTVVRSCTAFGVHRLIVLQEAAHPFHPKAIRASSGGIFTQSMWQGPSIQDLTQPVYRKWIVALDQKGEDAMTSQWPENIRLLVGEEGLGLPKGKFQQRLSIPQTGNVESLNAAMAISVALYSYRLRFPLPACRQE